VPPKIVSLNDSPESGLCCVWIASSCSCLLPVHYSVEFVAQVVMSESSGVDLLVPWKVGFVGGIVVDSGHLVGFNDGFKILRWSLDTDSGVVLLGSL
jgi:hypothetical protein